MQGTPALKENGPSQTHAAEPILLFGMPRSGTTWLGKIFDSHPDTLYRHEPDSFGRLNFISLAPPPELEPESAEILRRFVKGLAQACDTKIAATLPVFPKSYLSPMQLGWNRLAVQIAKLEARVRGEAPARLWLPRRNTRAARVVWKSIESPARLGAISAAIPKARGALIMRHPCGYIASVMRGGAQGRFTDPDSVGEDLGLLDALAATTSAREHGVTLDYLRAATPLQRLAWQWALANGKALAETAAAGRIMPLRYEDLCTEPLAVTERLFDWCELSWSEQTEAFLHASTHTHRKRYYSVYKDPARAANAWREELPESIQQEVMDTIGHTPAGKLYRDD